MRDRRRKYWPTVKRVEVLLSGAALCASLCPALRLSGRPLCASLPPKCHREAYTRVYTPCYTPSGRHIPGYTPPTNTSGRHIPGYTPSYTPWEAYTGFIHPYTPWEAYTRVYTSLNTLEGIYPGLYLLTHPGRHIPGLYHLLYPFHCWPAP